MSRLYKRRNLLSITVLIYFGLMLLILPAMLWDRTHIFPEIFSELISRLGESLIIAGVILLLVDFYYGRFKDVFSEQQALSAKGIKSLQELNPNNFDELLYYFSTSSQIALQFNVQEANRITIELVNTLQKNKRQKVQILATGIMKDEIREVPIQVDSSFEAMRLLQLLDRISGQDIARGNIEIRVIPTPTFHTLLLGERNAFLVVSYGTKREDSILLNVDFSSRLAEQYQQQFNELWEKADDIRA